MTEEPPRSVRAREPEITIELPLPPAGNESAAGGTCIPQAEAGSSSSRHNAQRMWGALCDKGFVAAVPEGEPQANGLRMYFRVTDADGNKRLERFSEAEKNALPEQERRALRVDYDAQELREILSGETPDNATLKKFFKEDPVSFEPKKDPLLVINNAAIGDICRSFNKESVKIILSKSRETAFLVNPLNRAECTEYTGNNLLRTAILGYEGKEIPECTEEKIEKISDMEGIRKENRRRPSRETERTEGALYPLMGAVPMMIIGGLLLWGGGNTLKAQPDNIKGKASVAVGGVLAAAGVLVTVGSVANYCTMLRRESEQQGNAAARNVHGR